MTDKPKRKPISEETRQKMREAAIRAQADPEKRKRIQEAATAAKKTKEHREKLREAALKRFADPAARQAARERTLKQFADPAARQAVRERTLKQFADPAAREKQRVATLKQFADPAARQKQREANKKQFSDPSKKARHQEACVGGFWYGAVTYDEGPQYCELWTEELRERVRSFFGYQCVECGTPQGKKRLQVHHVWYDKKICCNENPRRTLVPLCPSCHAKTTPTKKGNREYWSNHFQEMIDKYYNGKSWFTKEEYAAYINK